VGYTHIRRTFPEITVLRTSVSRVKERPIDAPWIPGLVPSQLAKQTASPSREAAQVVQGAASGRPFFFLVYGWSGRGHVH